MNIYRITLLDNAQYVVVSSNTVEAYKSLKRYLDNNDLHSCFKRNMKCIEILCEKVNDDDFDNVYNIIQK